MAGLSRASPWRYDAAAAETIRPENPATDYDLASWAVVFPISLVVRLPFYTCGADHNHFVWS
jgi:hypothetical protein